MRLYKRGDTWWADFWHEGRRVRRSSFTSDEAAAREWADTLKAGLWREAKLGERRSHSWDEAVLGFLAEKADKASLETDKDRLRWLSKHLAGKPLEYITTSVLRDLAKKIAALGRTNATVNRYLAAASGVMHYARDEELTAAVPKFPWRKEPKRRIRYLVDEAQADALIAELPKHVRPMARFALSTGLRRHNVTHLEWSSVDLKRKVAWYHPDEMKAGKALSCPLNADAIAVLEEQLKAKRRHKRWVFPFRGKPVKDVTTRLWHEACARAEIEDFTFHDFRHTWASWHVQRGTPLPALQELGGWASYAMVQKYAHLGRSHVAKWADNVARPGAKVAQPEKKPAKKAA